jgi:hypothetical protein
MVEWQAEGGLETADGGQRWRKKARSQRWSGGSERNDGPVRKTVGTGLESIRAPKECVPHSRNHNAARKRHWCFSHSLRSVGQ